MDKTFEEIISETLEEFKDPEDVNETDNVSEELEDEVEETSESDEDTENIDENESDEDDESETDSEPEPDLEADDEDNSVPSTNEKDRQAFIKLRQQNKEAKDELNKYKATVDYFDERAKAMGLSGIDELVERTKESEIKKEAEERNIPVEILKELNDLKATVAKQEEARVTAEKEREEARVSSTLNTFCENNHLSDKSIDKLARDLAADGISLDDFKSLSSPAITRILSSYLPKENIVQNNLAKKEKIKKELPPENDSKSSTKTQEDEIDKLAKLFAKM